MQSLHKNIRIGKWKKLVVLSHGANCKKSLCTLACLLTEVPGIFSTVVVLDLTWLLSSCVAKLVLFKSRLSLIGEKESRDH